jgi:hypothetical protein
MPEVQPIPVTFLCSEADPIVPNPSIPASTAVINETIRVKFYLFLSLTLRLYYSLYTHTNKSKNKQTKKHKDKIVLRKSYYYDYGTSPIRCQRFLKH